MDREDARSAGDEVVTPWRKASYSDTGANCVEVARTASGMVAVRDSKEREGGVLTVTVGGWGEFVAGMRDGAFLGVEEPIGFMRLRRMPKGTISACGFNDTIPKETSP